jgi:hypothetical protein
VTVDERELVDALVERMFWTPDQIELTPAPEPERADRGD